VVRAIQNKPIDSILMGCPVLEKNGLGVAEKKTADVFRGLNGRIILYWLEEFKFLRPFRHLVLLKNELIL
jgi:hypothetical protein